MKKKVQEKSREPGSKNRRYMKPSSTESNSHHKKNDTED